MNKIKKILKVGQKAHFWVKNHQNLHVFRYIDTTPRSLQKVEFCVCLCARLLIHNTSTYDICYPGNDLLLQTVSY